MELRANRRRFQRSRSRILLNGALSAQILALVSAGPTLALGFEKLTRTLVSRVKDQGVGLEGVEGAAPGSSQPLLRAGC